MLGQGAADVVVVVELADALDVAGWLGCCGWFGDWLAGWFQGSVSGHGLDHELLAGWLCGLDAAVGTGTMPEVVVERAVPRDPLTAVCPPLPAVSQATASGELVGTFSIGVRLLAGVRDVVGLVGDVDKPVFQLLPGVAELVGWRPSAAVVVAAGGGLDVGAPANGDTAVVAGALDRATVALAAGGVLSDQAGSGGTELSSSLRNGGRLSTPMASPVAVSASPAAPTVWPATLRRLSPVYSSCRPVPLVRSFSCSLMPRPTLDERSLRPVPA